MAFAPSPPYSGERVGVRGPSSDLDNPIAFPSLSISTQTNQNLDLLRREMSQLAFGSPTSAPAALALNSRHLQALDDAIASLNRAQDALNIAGDEVIALELRESLHSLGQILGQLTPDDLLGRIFSTFCIGK
jgi:tRNA modification GTPase